ncbi:MAG: hypothetical protein EZS28_026975 [Streblomastix strix]|uniref:Uncharacterized protein n=1 Tax=Streblomastix strix TaxID=222440 RepID=A0A5J4V4H3_9EUKA|nr:MAG: hypothetical protein EZS28_026975 [Streblomastix strix]
MSEIYSIYGAQIYLQLSDIGYSGALTVALCIAGGRGIQDSSIVHGVLVKLNKFYAEILIRKQLQLSVNMNLHCFNIVGERTGIRYVGWPFSKMSKNSIKPELSEPVLFENFDSPKFTTRTPVTTTVEQPELGIENRKFLQPVRQSTLQDIERWLTPRPAVSERTQALKAKVLQAMSGVRANEVNLWATNVLAEQNAEAWMREIQCPSLLPITSVPVTKRSTRLKAKSEQQNLLQRVSTDVIQFLNRRRNNRTPMRPTTRSTDNRCTQLDGSQLK